MCYGNGTFIAVGASGLILQSDPVVTLALSAGAHPGLTVSGPANRMYQIQYTEEIGLTNNWQTLTNVFAPATPFSWEDFQSTNSPRRFYRAVLAF
jgi:hypothetical protein